MNRLERTFVLLAALLCVTGATTPIGGAETTSADSIRSAVDATIPALMAKDGIPGMAVAVTVAGKAYVFNYGVASRDPRRPVTDDTLFEIGSVTKTFTATLASWAQVQHRLALTNTTAAYLPELRGTPFGNVTLLSLGTHTPGGLPLQFPDDITNDTQLMQYFKHWRPAYAIGTVRTYNNPGIAMLGLITAKNMGEDFRSLVEQQLFPALGLHETFIEIPDDARAQYAWGYTADGKPIRMTPGILWEEAYGVRTTAGDLIHFLQENVDPTGLTPTLGQAIVRTHTGYFQAGPMTQDLIWEQFPYPVTLSALLDGNSAKMLLQPTPVRAIVPSQPPQQHAWINKTGTTNGFGTYVAFVPSKHLGIVLLANKNYPITDRVTAAYRILSAVAHTSYQGN